MIGLLHTPQEWHEKCLYLRENHGLTLQENMWNIWYARNMPDVLQWLEGQK